MKVKTYPLSVKAQVIEYHTAGYSYTDISKILGVSRRSAKTWTDRYKGYQGENFELIIKESKV